MSEWQSAEHASAYLGRADQVPHRSEGQSALLDELPIRVRRVLDLGSGDGRVLALVLRARPAAKGVAVDFSPTMLDQLRARFLPTSGVEVVKHDLEAPLPILGTFDVVISSFAIHHPAEEDPSNKVLDVHTQLEWLRAIGFIDVDCYWKWRELALLVGRRPSQ